MKRLGELVRAAGDAALQLTLPLFEAPPASPAPPARPAGRRVVRLGEHFVEYALQRTRRRTIGFLIDDAGLRVTAPRWVTLAEIDAALQEKRSWILRKLAEWREHSHRRERLTIRWGHGERFTFLGREVTMHVSPGARGVELAEQRLIVGLPPNATPEQLRDAVHAWLQAQAREVFAQRLPVYARRLGREPRRWGLSSARTRWGSCGPDGSIRLNWRLVHFPLDVVDYVIAHELAHLEHLDHGPRFWATVQALLPEFEPARRRLRDFPDDLTLS
jgi:hypothetical protein